jgi:4-amino-4-deoxy-L-arabinose transferase-like glycosyltransferase
MAMDRLRARWRSIPPVAGAVFLVALLNGLAWSILTPPFQVPDETAHFAYAQHLAETGNRAGVAGRPEFSSEQSETMSAIGTLGIIGRPLVRPVATQAAGSAADDQIRHVADTAPRDDGGGPSTASSQPPLYYALEAVPYWVFSGASLPTRLVAMRATSVVMFALAAALCALLAAELLPRWRWAAPTAGLAIALSPYTAFISAGVTPDAFLLLVSTAVLLVVARAFRHGLTERRAITLGLLVGAGAISKLTFFAFVPPAALALAILVWRDRPPWRVPALSIGASLLLPVAFALYVAIVGGSLSPTGTGTPALPPEQVKPGSLREFVSYTWQLYLPRLPFQIDQFGFSAPYETWIKGFAGKFGWLDYQVAEWIVRVARDVVIAGLAMLLVAAVRFRAQLRRHLAELVAYAAFAAALAFAIAKKGYDYHRATLLVFEQARYLFPLAGLYGAAVALALAAFGRRAAPILAIAAVALFAVHDVVGVMTTFARYYG